jgi:IS5 family transposase
LRLPFDTVSPDHSTFSRFRKRLSEEALMKVNSEVLNQFAEKGLSINEDIAIDARLVESASRPISGHQLKELREKRQTDEGKLDRNSSHYKSCK